MSDHEAVAEIVGEQDAEHVRIMDAGADLMESGIIVELHIGRWRGRKKVTLEDLGLADLEGEERKSVEEAYILGQKNLLPAQLLKDMNAVENKGRRALTTHSFQTPWGRFVPAKAYEGWKKANAELEEAYCDMRDRLIENYETYQANMITHFRRIAPSIHRKQQGHTDLSEQEWTERFLRSVELAYPSEAYLADSFHWSTRMSYIPFIYTAHPEPQEQSQAQIAAMQREVNRQMENQRQGVMMGFFSDIKGQFYGLIDRTVRDVQKRIRENEGRLPGRSVVQLRNVIEEIKLLNVFEDDQLTERMEAIQRELERESKDRDLLTIQNELSQIRADVNVQMVDVRRVERMTRTHEEGDEIQAPTRRVIRTEGVEGTDDTPIGARRVRQRPQVDDEGQVLMAV